MAKSSSQHLVYLSEKDCENELLNRVGVHRLRTSVQWFEDHRHTPQHNAAYLKKLETLRAEVLAQEQANLKQTISRLNADGYGAKTGDVAAPGSRPRPSATGETYPERYKRLQRQRSELLKKKKRRQTDERRTRISVIQGERLLDRTPDDRDAESRWSDNGEASDARSAPSVGGDSVNVHDLISFQKARLGQASAAGGVALVGSLQHQSSIPNLGRKSAKQTKPLLPVSDYDLRRTDSFIRQMALHHKDARGLYRGAHRRHLLRGDTDEIDLSPDAFRFDVVSEKQFSSGAHYSAPIPTPVLANTPASMKHPKRDPRSAILHSAGDILERDRDRTASDNGEHPGEDERGAKTEDAEEYRLYRHVDYPLPVRQVHAALLRTPSSVYAPTNRGYIRVLETGNQRASRGRAGRRSGLDELRISGTTSDRSSRRMADFLRDHPDAVSVKTDAGDVIVVNRSNTELNCTLDAMSAVTYVNTPEYTRTTTPAGDAPSPERRVNRLLVQMPDIVLNPPTPTCQVASDEDVVHLRRTVRQNEIRKKELAGLLDDVKQLNELCEGRLPGDASAV